MAEVERRKVVPIDPRFRRSLFVMLVTLGVLIAAGYMQVREAKNETRGFKTQVTTLSQDNERLKAAIQALTVAQQRLSDLLVQRTDEATKQRTELNEQIKKLQEFILLLLQKNSYVTVTKVSRGPKPSTQPAPSGSPTPRPGPSGSPRPRPTPTGSPKPSPTCVDVAPLHICIGGG